MPEGARAIFEVAATQGFDPRLQGVTGTYQFNVEEAGHWHVTVRDGHITIKEAEAAADCVLGMSEDDFVAVAHGERNLLTAAMQGRVTITGDLVLAQKFHGMVRAAGRSAERSHG
jgi:putative sterol carrier protein